MPLYGVYHCIVYTYLYLWSSIKCSLEVSCFLKLTSHFLQLLFKLSVWTIFILQVFSNFHQCHQTQHPSYHQILARLWLGLNWSATNFSAPFFSLSLPFLFTRFLYFTIVITFMACENMDFWLCSCITYVITISTHMDLFDVF